MTEKAFAACLAAVLNGEDGMDEIFDSTPVDRAVPYDEAGMLTNNAGFLVRLDDGTEFQVTVVRSRHGRRDDTEDEG